MHVISALILAGGGLVASISGSALAQAFPVKPIRVIIPQTPGAGVDLILRKAAEELTPRLGQTLVIDNQPAANSVVAADMCARAAPDGHTVCVLNNDAVAINPHIFANLIRDRREFFGKLLRDYNIPRQ